MRRIMALTLAFSFALTSCASISTSDLSSRGSLIVASESSEAVLSENNDEAASNSSTEIKEKETATTDIVTDDLPDYQWIEDQEIVDANYDLGDEQLQQYLKDKIYLEAIANFDSNEYVVDNVEARYYSKEYLENLDYNSQGNIYFGFTQEELDEQFSGKKYVFTLGDNGETTVTEVESYEDHTTEEVLKNVAIGSGVILVCITVSTTTMGAAPAVGMIFAMGAKTGTAMALSGGAIGGISAGIIKGYQTGSFTDAMQATVVSASDGFKWGAITGALSGGASEAWGLYSTANSTVQNNIVGKANRAAKEASKAEHKGLTMNQVAKIQHDSKYPLDVIKGFKSMDEYEIYKNAGLRVQMIEGKLALVQDIDWNQKVTLPDGSEVTNKWLVEHGNAPFSPEGYQYELHHVNQDANGTLAILNEQQHRGKGMAKILNLDGKTGVHNSEAGIPDSVWDKQRKAFWKDFMKQSMAN